MCTQPSVKPSDVASGLFQYSEKFITPQIHSSPVSIGAQSRPSSATAFTRTMGRHRAAATAWTLQERLAADRGGEPLGLGHAPAGSGRTLGDRLVDLACVFGGPWAHRRPPALLRLERSYLPRFGDWTSSHAMVGTPLNSVMRSASMMRRALFCVPLVHAHELAAATKRRQGLHDQSGHVEQRNGQDHGGRMFGLRGRAAPPRPRERGVHLHGDGARPHSQPNRALVIAR